MDHCLSKPLTELPVTDLKGVGDRVAEHLTRLDIYSVQDLLFHLPSRYEDRTCITSINKLRPGDRVLIEGVVEKAAVVGRRRRSLVCRLADATGFIHLRFFHFNKSQYDRLMGADLQLRCFGEVRAGYQGGLEMVHPEYRHLQNAEQLPLADHLTPIYPTTKGLQQTTLRKLITQALDYLMEPEGMPELLPKAILQRFNLTDLSQALILVHRPTPKIASKHLQAGTHPAQQRLAFEELIAHQLSLLQLRKQVQSHPALALQVPGVLQQQLLEALSFTLTSAQQKVIHEILQDLRQSRPMLRLVQGDVGSGKTIVSAMAVLQAVEAGYQAAVMAPTELLAEQHLRNFKQWLTPLGIQVGWLSGKHQGKAREASLACIASGEDQVIVGTHALFQEAVQFHQLALLVVDEQHRFGVHQRLALREKGLQEGCYPHQLIMTATPIPRTLAMMAYADLECSVIDELPPGRKPIKTVLVSNQRRQEVIERVQVNCEQNRQVYWVCTLIEESEVLQCQAAEATAVELKKRLPSLRIGLVHGRLKQEEKENIMAEFASGRLQLLVATTVIEVGVDVPNASLMIIENPERLGLAQLHQLRGRVGRGTEQSHCVLLFQLPLSHSARQRLDVMRNTQDGFAIARCDLEMRGPGEVLGTRQAGLIQLQIADLIRDKHLLPHVQAAGRLLLEEYPQCVPHLMQRWIRGGERYARV